MEVILFRQILSVTTTSKMNSKAIINRAITPKMASHCRTLIDLFFQRLAFDTRFIAPAPSRDTDSVYLPLHHVISYQFYGKFGRSCPHETE